MTSHTKLQAWVEEMSALCEPNEVRWCDGTEAEYDEMFQLMLDSGTAIKTQ